MQASHRGAWQHTTRPAGVRPAAPVLGQAKPRRLPVVRCDPSRDQQPRDMAKGDAAPQPQKLERASGSAAGVPAQVPQPPPHPELEGVLPSTSSSNSSSSSGAAGGNVAPRHPELDAMDLTSSGGSPSSGEGIPDTLPLLGADSDWREFRAKLISRARAGASTDAEPAAPDAATAPWAHALARPERGALLLAHPLMFLNSQRYFFKAAILLLDHGEDGSFGVILNHPSKYVLRDCALTRTLPQFDDCRLYVGGDVGDDLMFLHPYGSLEGAQEVVKGLYIGGLSQACAAVDAGSATASNFRWFFRYAGWGPGQLQQECKRGVWFPAAASPELILKDSATEQGVAYWHKVMELMGGDYAKLSEAAKGKDDGSMRGPADLGL